jgi:O-acetyl-ADP-ribose deacetylase (regulator of RNase III)
METVVSDKISLVQDDITRLRVDAIVNAANTSLLGGGGVDGAIHRAAGSELLEECRSLGGCPTGEARITLGYNLPSRFVIHTVGPVYTPAKKDESERLLRACYQNCLILAKENSLKTIAFPAVSCGVYGYPVEDACNVAISTVTGFLGQKSDLEMVTFVLFSDDYFNVYKQHVEGRKP